MTIPQAKGILKNVLLILIMGPIGGVALASLGGELHTWKDIPVALDHGAFMAVGIACGWVFLRSPWAAEYQSLVQRSTEVKQTDGGPKVTTETTKSVTMESSPESPKEQQ